ncbi:MAG: XdhC family protein [Spirochaetaceae bacterium]|jgi:xanthine dehydrogenase accessory factor|nr:XdhC family protein [Spirochaetaceae bacterium]
MDDIVEAMKQAFQRGEGVVLAVINRATGSTPRKKGALMLVGQNGRLAGTIGGAIAEHLAIQEGQRLLAAKQSGRKEYLLHPNEAADLGAKCGGEITVDFRFIPAGNPVSAAIPADFFAPQAHADIVYIFGGGHVAQALVPVLVPLGFRLRVFEDRAQFVQKSLFPGADEVILGSFSNIREKIIVSGNDYVIILTRGHIFDYEAEAFALQSAACYIGVIGSTQKRDFINVKLRDAGFGEEAIFAHRVHAPIGLPIESETPEEIAVSIAAELVLWRAKRRAIGTQTGAAGIKDRVNTIGAGQAGPLLFTFDTIAAALEAEKVFQHAGIPSHLAPPPENLDVSCAYTLTAEAQGVCALPEDAKIEYSLVFKGTADPGGGETYRVIKSNYSRFKELIQRKTVPVRRKWNP